MELKIVFVFLTQILSIVLQCVSFSSPGWIVRHMNNGQVIMSGLFYQRTCYAQGTCEYKSNLDLVLNNPVFHKEQSFNIVDSAFKGGLSIIFGAVVLTLYIMSVCINQWWMIYYLFCAILSMLSGVLQWILLAPIANTNVIYQAEETELGIEQMGVPWCIVLYSLTALHSTTAFVVYMLFLIKELFHIVRYERTI
ncbi:hypothetical protein ACJMK2_006805 [Sinanodonta woodiana]|uniref:Uncharacterized protein n=1 Tax=Sinanodonta woodiana TaxID=1069815 RepID=A0ABD3VUA0_SINWO